MSWLQVEKFVKLYLCGVGIWLTCKMHYSLTQCAPWGLHCTASRVATGSFSLCCTNCCTDDVTLCQVTGVLGDWCVRWLVCQVITCCIFNCILQQTGMSIFCTSCCLFWILFVFILAVPHATPYIEVNHMPAVGILGTWLHQACTMWCCVWFIASCW